MKISVSLEDYSRKMQQDGWIVIPNAVDPELVGRMLIVIEKAWDTCRAVMTKTGVVFDAQLTVHHLGGQQQSFLDFIDDMEPLMPYLEHYFQGKFILNSFGGALNTRGKTSYAHRVHRDIRSYSGRHAASAQHAGHAGCLHRRKRRHAHDDRVA